MFNQSLHACRLKRRKTPIRSSQNEVIVLKKIHMLSNICCICEWIRFQWMKWLWMKCTQIFMN